MYVFQKAEIALAEVTRAISAFANLFQIELETVIYVSTWVCFEPFRRDSTRSKDGLQFKYNLFRRFVSLLAARKRASASREPLCKCDNPISFRASGSVEYAECEV